MEQVRCNDKKCVLLTNMSKKVEILKDKNIELVNEIAYLIKIIMNTDVLIDDKLIKIIEKYYEVKYEDK